MQGRFDYRWGSGGLLGAVCVGCYLRLRWKGLEPEVDLTSGEVEVHTKPQTAAATLGIVWWGPASGLRPLRGAGVGVRVPCLDGT